MDQNKKKKQKQPLSIGKLNESLLHYQLKEEYTQPGDRVEAEVDGYIIDILRGGLCIEIQTGNFSNIKKKLDKLIKKHKVRLVYPIPAEKWIVTISPDTGEVIRRKKSPGKKSQYYLCKR